MIVYAVGEVSYDARVELPSAIFSTIDLAKQHAGAGVEWDDDEHEVWGKNGPQEWIVRRYEVDKP